MQHIGILCPPLPGHLNPIATLGRALVCRGYRVTVFQVADIEARVRAQGLNFRALGTPSADLDDMIDRMGKLSGIGSLRFVVQAASKLAGIICREAPSILRSERVDLLLVDQNEPAGGSVAEYLGLPFVNVCPSLPLNREHLIPPPFVPWGYAPSLGGRIRNLLGYRIADRLIAPVNQAVNEYRRTWKLPPLKSPDDSFSDLAQLCQMPRALDFPRTKLPSGFHYLGPFLDLFSGGECPPFPFERLDGRPLIYASFGTLQSEADSYFERIEAACAGLEVQLVIATGRTAHAMPENRNGHIVVGYAPQMELLSRAALTITHAGLNTVLQSLYNGVPMLAIPMTHDQPAIAARVQYTGSGIVLAPGRSSVRRLRKAIQRLTREPAYRTAAVKLRNAIHASGGVQRGADVVESCI